MTIPVAVDRPDVMSSVYAYSIPVSSWDASYDKIFIVIVAATADVSGLCMNGTLLMPASFITVGNSLYSAARVRIRPGYGFIKHMSDRPFTAYWFCYATWEGAGSILPAINVSLASTCPAAAVQATTTQAGETAVLTTTSINLAQTTVTTGESTLRPSSLMLHHFCSIRMIIGLTDKPCFFGEHFRLIRK
jgi:hypothetical protein